MTRLYLLFTLSNTAGLNSALIIVISVCKQHRHTFHLDFFGKGGAERRHPKSHSHVWASAHLTAVEISLLVVREDAFCCGWEGCRVKVLATQILFLKCPSFQVRCQHPWSKGCPSVVQGAEVGGFRTMICNLVLLAVPINLVMGYRFPRWKPAYYHIDVFSKKEILKWMCWHPVLY